MSELQAKVCVLGAFSVGKTSLVSRFVRGIFSERYLATVGVKIDKKEVRLPERTVQLLLWDLQGEDQAMPLRASHLRGAAGYLLVVDGTRPQTLDVALELDRRARAELGEVPSLLLLNKHDLSREWAIEPEREQQLAQGPAGVLHTSARTGSGVEQAFARLAAAIAERSG